MTGTEYYVLFYVFNFEILAERASESVQTHRLEE